MKTTVYHVTTENLLPEIEVIGLVPNPHRGRTDEWVEREQLHDLACPPELCEKGITRADVIYAHPSDVSINGIYGQSTARSSEPALQRLATLAIEVDPQSAIVCDAWLFGNIYEPDDYWMSAKGFDQYLKDPTYIDMRTKYKTQLRYLQPEVLIPGGVSPERITVHSLSMHPLRKTVIW